MLALELLGSVRLLRDDVVLPITIRKTLALLTLLACSEPLPRTRVVDLLWPALDEATGRRNLRRELARLREAGAAHAVRADGDFLMLDAGVVLDARTAEDDLRSGFVERSLSRFRGIPMDGLRLDDAPGFDEWLDAQRSRLLRLRTSVLEVSAREHEQRGEGGIALQRIEQLLDLDPLQEQHHRDAMRLLTAGGRREAALAQYERCRAVLRDELGLQPMVETEALAASLRGAGRGADTSPPVALPIAADAPRMPAQLPFVGRSDEVALLEAAWRTGSAIVIEGEGGVGKTRLALDFASAHGPYALARCRSGDADIPYASFTRALRTLGGPAPDLSALAPWVVGELARLLPELGVAPPAMRSAEERSRFFEACAIGWCVLAVEEFDAVVLDDWQHADAASRALLVFVAQRRREVAPLAAREIVLLRPQSDAAGTGALAERLQGLHLALQPLDGDAVFDLVRQLSGAESPERFAGRLQRATGGNPFFLAETLRQLIELGLLQQGPGGVWRTPYDDATRDYHELPLPPSVRDAVLSRVNRLGAAGVRVLEAAALAGDAFAPSLLAPACALSELDTVLAIERAVQARLLREHEAGGFAFAHDLVQQALEASLSQERRRLVHRRLALGAEAGGAPPAQIARHHEASGDRRRAVVQRLAAGDAAQRLNALTEAVMHWRKGLEDDPTASQAMALRLRLMRTLRLLDERDASRAEIDALRALAAGPELSVDERSDTLIAAAGELTRDDRSAEGLTLIDALPDTLSDLQRALAMQVRVDALRELGCVDEALAAAQVALSLPALQGSARASLLDSLLMAEHLAGRPRAALGHAEASLALSQASGDALGVARGHSRRGVFLIELGELDSAEVELRLAAEHCGRLGLVGMQRAALYNLCCLHSTRDRPARVIEAAEEIWRLTPPMQHSELRVMVHLAFVDAQMALGDLGAAWQRAQAALDDALAIGEPIAVGAVGLTCLELFALLGERGCAERLLDAISDDSLQQMPQLASQMRVAQANFELIAGSSEAARNALATLGDPEAISNDMVRARLALVSAELALAEGDPARALDLLPGGSAQGVNHEIRARALAIRLAAQAHCGALPPELLAEARTALAAPTLHAISALAIARALRAEHGVGTAVDPGSIGARVAASLQAQPQQQAAFIGWFG